MPAKTIFVMGPTCAGKSTFLNAAVDEFGSKVGLVQVGKILRERYSPEHFAGQAGPEHTEQEAWSIFEEEYQRLEAQGCRVILVDGMPRNRSQVHKCLSYFNAFTDDLFLLLDAPKDIREHRARESRSGSDLHDLTLPRLTNDMIACYEVIAELVSYCPVTDIVGLDTSNTDGLEPRELFAPFFESEIAGVING